MDRFTYRGKTVNGGEWFTGAYLDCGGLGFIIGHADVTAGKEQISAAPYAEVDPRTVGQCTGFVDSSGTPVFEGDRIHKNDWSTGNEDIYATVIWHEAGRCWRLEENGKSSDDSRIDCELDDWKIIGNIHDQADHTTPLQPEK